MMEDDPDKINDADRALEAHILKAGESYAESTIRQRAENKRRAENRKRISDLGIRTDAYQTAIKLVKDLTDSERKDFIRDLRLVTKVLGARQADLFPDEKIKAEKRVEKAKERAAKKPRGKDELDAATNANPRSNPATGGAAAGKKRGRKPKPAGVEVVSQTGVTTEDVPLVEESGDELIARVAREKMAALEQREGGQILDTAMDGIKSQSEKSADALAKAGLA